MKPVHLDANVLVRFFLLDEPKQGAAASKLIAEAQAGVYELLVDPMIVAETVYVLTSVYKRARINVAELLITFVRSPNVRVESEREILDALLRFRNTSVDFADAWLAAKAASTGHPVASFDKDLDRFQDITRLKPKS